MFVSVAVEGSAVADTSPYELYCPGTAVGTIVFNGVITTGSLSPSKPTKGQSFSIINYQTTYQIPTEVIDAMAALGATTAKGYIRSTLDVADAKPAKRSVKESYSSPIPSTITSPLPVAAPSSPVEIGPLKATGTSIVVTGSTQVPMTLDVLSHPITSICVTYPNDATASGITTGKPKGSPVAPVVARSG